MNSFKTRRAAGALVASLVLASIGGCAMEQGPSMAGIYADDATITDGVKTGLATSNDVTGEITVQTLNGSVMLSGFVDSERDRRAAQRIARSVTGVQKVRNDLEVRY